MSRSTGCFVTSGLLSDRVDRAGCIREIPIRDLVIDTNVVLDWLAFGHPIGAPLQDELASGRCRWLCTRAMRDELARVIARESLKRWAIDAHAVLDVFDSLGVDVGTPASPGEAGRLRCSDPDDQKFIDLAMDRGAHALLTRDRALLRLASRARRFGVLVAPPEAWLDVHRSVRRSSAVSSSRGRDRADRPACGSPTCVPAGGAPR